MGRGRGFRTHLHVVMQFDNIMDYTYMRAVLNKLTVIPMRHGKGWEHRIGTDIEKIPGEGRDLLTAGFFDKGQFAFSLSFSIPRHVK